MGHEPRFSGPAGYLDENIDVYCKPKAEQQLKSILPQ